MADALFPVLKLIPKIKAQMLRVNFDSLTKVKLITLPILFISGSIDTFVPTEQTIKLHSTCGSATKDLWVVPGGNHNDTWLVAGESYILRLKAFFDRHRHTSSKT